MFTAVSPPARIGEGRKWWSTSPGDVRESLEPPLSRLTDQQPNGLKVPELVEGVMEACGAIEEAALDHIGKQKIETRIPPLRDVAIFEALPLRELLSTPE